MGLNFTNVSTFYSRSKILTARRNLLGGQRAFEFNERVYVVNVSCCRIMMFDKKYDKCAIIAVHLPSLVH